MNELFSIILDLKKESEIILWFVKTNIIESYFPNRFLGNNKDALLTI